MIEKLVSKNLPDDSFQSRVDWKIRPKNFSVKSFSNQNLSRTICLSVFVWAERVSELSPNKMCKWNVEIELSENYPRLGDSRSGSRSDFRFVANPETFLSGVANTEFPSSLKNEIKIKTKKRNFKTVVSNCCIHCF